MYDFCHSFEIMKNALSTKDSQGKENVFTTVVFTKCEQHVEG